MKTIIFAIGNSLRRDDGAAHRVLELLEPHPGVLTRSLLQLAPEQSEEIAPARMVVFVDADIEPGPARIERLPRGGPPPRSPLAHSLRPAEIVALARSLFHFTGQAYVCHVPGADFSEGEGLSGTASRNAIRAAELLRDLLYTPESR
ncbi:MAG TPA: hypothetical protein VFQ79_08740 [Bryobacteraceae bacterium]|nr:hypothetical protein [Bryobacteraceae bacterium]